MKYEAVLFDWGDTLSVLNKDHVPITNNWIKNMLRKLFHHSYRLGIISNTHRYQDLHWIRKELLKYDALHYFECIISSAMYGYHKPDIRIFEKAVNFMEIDPSKTIMVGDSKHCDGASQILGMTYMYVESGERWEDKLYQILEEQFPSKRKLSNVAEYGLLGDKLIVPMRHLSESICPGDSIVIAKLGEYKVLECDSKFTKEDVINRKNKDRYVQFKVEKI